VIRGLFALTAVVCLVFSSGPAFGGSSVKIGVLVDLTGDTKETGRAAIRVSQMALDAVNAQGGVAGRQVELTSFDTQGDPALVGHGARDLVSFRDVSAVLGPTNWATAMVTKPFLEEAQVPAMMLTWEDSVIRGGKYGMYEWIFQLPLTRAMALERIAEFVRGKGWRRVGLVIGPDALGREAKAWFRSRSRSHGIERLLVVSFMSTGDMRGKLLSLARRDPQAIVCWSSLPDAAMVATNLRELGVTVPLFQSHEISPQRYVEMAGPAARQSLMVSNKLMVWTDLREEDPQKRIIQDFLYRYRNVYGYAQRHPVSPFSGYIWDSVMILVRSMSEAGTAKAQVREGIERIHRHIGLGGIYGFTRKDHNGLDPNSLVVMKVDGIEWDGNRWTGSWRMAE
jgi:branched-chain amino acid transport system substrate-binding protein